MNEENKKLCSKDNPCQECQAKQQELLAKTEDWEVKWKEKIEEFEFIEAKFCHNRIASNDKVKYSGDESYNYHSIPCPSCQAVIKIIKSNGHGDKTEELKEHAANCQQHKSTSYSSSSKQSNTITTTEREREREREREQIRF